MSDQNNQPDHPISEIPVWAKRASDWIRLVLLFVTPLSLLLSFVLDKTVSLFISSVLVGGFAFGYVAIPHFRSRFRPFSRIERLLAKQKALSRPERDQIASDVHLLRRILFATTFAAIMLLALAVWFWIAPGIMHFYRTAVPTSVQLRRASYYNPSRDAPLINRNPWISAVWGQLKEEAGASRVRMAMIETEPFNHPTPPFTLVATYEESQFDFSGYAFLTRRNADGTESLTSLHMKYDGKQIHIESPGLRTGDSVMLLGRLGVRGQEFPENLFDVFKMTAHPDLRKPQVSQ